jgi:2-polyprenyl-6-hydroxyphenyl methylase/3-demethylubiquinone-9 3-methyltransferase
VLTGKLELDPKGTRTLDVGCGGGLLAEEFAALGCDVVGLDPSGVSLETARAHARTSGLEIEYVQGSGEQLPFEDAAFDIVYCCDVLEHVDDLPRVIGEIARVLRPGGVFLYDTINRTPMSKLLMIKVFQEWESTRWMEPNVHDWQMFIKPKELFAELARAGLENRELTGLKPPGNPISLIRTMKRRRRGEISYAELGRTMGLRQSRDKSVMYMGHAVKPQPG